MARAINESASSADYLLECAISVGKLISRVSCRSLLLSSLTSSSGRGNLGGGVFIVRDASRVFYSVCVEMFPGECCVVRMRCLVEISEHGPSRVRIPFDLKAQRNLLPDSTEYGVETRIHNVNWTGAPQSRHCLG